MMQGDQYKIGFRVMHPETVPPIEDALEIEVSVGDIRKRMTKGEVSYLAEDHAIVTDLTQQETLGICPGSVEMQVRVKFADGEVQGTTAGEIHVEDALSEEVL